MIDNIITNNKINVNTHKELQAVELELWRIADRLCDKIASGELSRKNWAMVEKIQNEAEELRILSMEAYDKLK